MGKHQKNDRKERKEEKKKKKKRDESEQQQVGEQTWTKADFTDGEPEKSKKKKKDKEKQKKEKKKTKEQKKDKEKKKEKKKKKEKEKEKQKKKNKNKDKQQSAQPIEPYMPDDEQESPLEYAVPLNRNCDSLSPGNNLYDALFSFEVETPPVWVDPTVWNIAYAAVPAGYSIPDPVFVNTLAQRVAWQLVEPTITTANPTPATSSLFNRFLQILARPFGPTAPPPATN
ncbi:hypothetical protein [Effusibacillus pohliae]|uniref:hypothetical protein n=1 Tax=Effusibacillus pohliae TaxID=232270 RepID=UPI0003826C3F|nr:hypothetical protein [Effusibacillus pohliae]